MLPPINAYLSGLAALTICIAITGLPAGRLASGTVSYAPGQETGVHRSGLPLPVLKNTGACRRRADRAKRHKR